MAPERDWRAPIAAGAYLLMAVCASVLVTLILGYFLFVSPIEHSQKLATTALSIQQGQTATLDGIIVQLRDQATDRQNDTNTIATALCVQRIRSLVTYRDTTKSDRDRQASLKTADDTQKLLNGLHPHPPTKCKGIDPKP